MDPFVSWLILPVVMLYLAGTFLFAFFYAMYRMANQRDLLTPGETLCGVLMMITLPIFGAVAMIIYTYHLEHKALRRANRADDNPYAAAEADDWLELSELSRRRERRRMGRK